MAREKKQRKRIDVTRPAANNISADITVKDDTNYRTRLLNGEAIIEGAGSGQKFTRQVRSFYANIVADLGGDDMVSTIQSTLALQYASIASLGGTMVAQRAADDDEYDLLMHLLLIKTMAMLGKQIGMGRQMRQAGEASDLQGYLKKDK